MNTSNRDPRNELIHAIRGEKQYMHLNEIKRVNSIFQNNQTTFHRELHQSVNQQGCANVQCSLVSSTFQKRII